MAHSFFNTGKDARMDTDVGMESLATMEALRIQCPRLDRNSVEAGQVDPWTYTLAFVDDDVIELILKLKVMDKQELVKYKSLEVENAAYPGTMIYNRRLPLFGSQSVETVVAEKFYRDAGRTGNHLFKLMSTQAGDICHRADVIGHRSILMNCPELARLIHENNIRRFGTTGAQFQQGMSSLNVRLEHFVADRKIFQEVVRYIYCRQRPQHLMFDLAVEGRPYGCWESLFRILDQLGVQDLLESCLAIWRTYLTQESALQNYRLWAFKHPAVVQTIAEFVVAHASEPYEGRRMITYMDYVVDRCSDVDFLPTVPHKTLMMHIAALKSTNCHPVLVQ
ncbi:hypothetical protein BGZ73_008905 [Actinomortierella ambigua]|nr:hypothetical protein BGZ73_008905 [Actinomortierella ambigua]